MTKPISRPLILTIFLALGTILTVSGNVFTSIRAEVQRNQNAFGSDKASSSRPETSDNSGAPDDDYLDSQSPAVTQPTGIVLSNSGTSTISWVFDTSGWQQTTGSTLHTGDDDYAQDWSRGTGQTAGQNAYAAISGVVAKSYLSSSTYGNTVVIYDTEHGFAVRYAHLQARNVSEGQTVEAGTTLIGQVGNSGSTPDNPFNPHLHIVLYRNVTGTDGRPISFVSLSDSNSPYRAPFVFTADRVQGCNNGTSTLRNRDGGPPIHPPGSVIKVASDQTVYLIDSDNRKRPITSASVLAQLYNQSTDARTSTNFSNWVITVGQDELDLYEQGGNLSAAQLGNGMPFPDGKLIGYSGEVSIVTGGGKRRPFGDGSRFTGLGYNFCQVVNLSQSEYNSYPQGPPVDAMPVLTSSVSLLPAGPYTVGQNITGNFTIKNVGYASIPFSSLGIGGRFGSAIYDLGFVSTTLTAGSSYSFGSQTVQLTSTGTYDFFAAYQEGNTHWAISVPAVPGVIRNREISVQQSGTGASIALTNGWNLISLPLQPSNHAITTVLSGISGKYSAVWGWDASSQTWRSYFPSNPGFSNLSTMDSGNGYWLYMTSPATLSVSGSTPSKTISLLNQWNLVGYNGASQISITSALSSINGKYLSAWAWNSSTQAYQSYIPSNPGFSNLTTMDTGRGYWIYATQNTSWTVP